jgi:hypothetical protein
MFGISAQMAVRAISKSCEAYKRDKSIKPKEAFRHRREDNGSKGSEAQTA